MFRRLRASWMLTKACINVLKQDKELLLFPVFCGLITVLCTIGFIVPVYAIVGGEAVPESADLSLTLLGIVYSFVIYSVVLFFNVAVLSCAKKRFEGGDPTLADGFRAGMDNLGVIFSWAAVGGVVSFIMKQLEESLGLFGLLIARLLGSAFAILSFFAIPVMVFEKVGPVQAFKRSGEIIKKTWGESLGAYLGFSIITTIVGWVIIFSLIGSIALSATMESFTPFSIGGVVSLLLLLAASVLSSCLSQIFQAALYVYATTGEVPAGISQELVTDAFKVKKGRKWVLA